VSSYEFDLPIAAEFDHRCTLSINNNKVKERLFLHEPSNP